MPAQDPGGAAGTARAVLAGLADSRVHSGQDLADRLGMTRAAIWKQVAALREQGLPIAAVAGRGYQLPWPLELLDKDTIMAALGAPSRKALASLDVVWRPTSTSDLLRQRSHALDHACRVVLAESQSAGRGRRGRAWLAPPGVNICLSAGLRFECGAVGLAGLSLATGVMLVRALNDIGCSQAGLKWPNDVVTDSGKLAGILVEIDGEYSGPSDVVIGVGLNLRGSEALCAAAGQPVAALVDLLPDGLPSRNALAAALIRRLLEGLDDFRHNGFAAFADDYARDDRLLKQDLRIVTGRGEWHGQGAGIDANGALRVRTAEGIVPVDSAEVSVRSA